MFNFSEIGHVTSAQFYNYKTSSQPFLNNFPGILYVLRCLSQHKKFLTWKTAEPNRLHRFYSCHYIGSRQNGPLAGRWQMCQRKVVQNQLLPTADPFKHHNRQIQTTFQSTKIITAGPRRLRPSLRSKQDLCQNLYGDTYKKFDLNFDPLIINKHVGLSC